MRAILWRRLGTSLLALAVALVPALASPSAAQAVPGLIYTSAFSRTEGGDRTLSATATCPRGTVAIGGGGIAFGLSAADDSAPNELIITQIRPVLFGSPGYRVTATEDATGFDGGWQVTAQAICAPEPPGHQLVWESTGPPDPAASKLAVVSCPPGKQVMDAGASIIAGGPHVALNGFFPNEDLTKVGAIANADDSGVSGNWSLEAWAICTYPQPGQLRMVGDALSTFISCPVGLDVHGSGALPTGQSGQMRLNQLTHFPHGVTANLFEDEDGYSGPGGGPPVAIPIAICAS